MERVLAIVGAGIVAVYLASVLQWQGAVQATNQLTWILGAIVLGISLGLLFTK